MSHMRKRYTLKEVVDHFANLESDDGDDSGVIKTYFLITNCMELFIIIQNSVHISPKTIALNCSFNFVYFT